MKRYWGELKAVIKEDNFLFSPFSHLPIEQEFTSLWKYWEETFRLSSHPLPGSSGVRGGVTSWVGVAGKKDPGCIA